MKNFKTMKTLARTTTTTTTTTTDCAAQSSVPVGKRLKPYLVYTRRGIHRTSKPRGRRCITAGCNGRLFGMYNTSSAKMLRQESALHFYSDFNLVPVLRYHIRAGASRVKKLQVTSLGILWLAVRGGNSICVVARREDVLTLEQQQQQHPDQDRARSGIIMWNSDLFLHCFWIALISEVEGSPGQSALTNRPFGVVSLIEQDSNKEVQNATSAASAEYDAGKAIEFLRKEVESGAVFNPDKTTQTAISAFQHLFGKEFEDDEIRVYLFKYDDGTHGKEFNQTRKVLDIEEFLAIINGPGAGACV